MNLIAAYAHSTRARTLKRLQNWALCGAVALAGLLGAGQALAASSPPYVDNGDGTVTDTSTGLMWDQCTWGFTSANGGCTVGGTGRSWDAVMELPTTGHRGYSDWRVPSKAELQSLVKAGATNPAIDNAAFPATLSAGYWTSTTVATINAWVLHFNVGGIDAFHKSMLYFVRLVRSGQCLYPFSMLPVTVTAVGPTTAAFTATSSFATTGYWVVVARNAQAPTPAQITAGNNSAGVAAVASGSVAMGAGSPASDAVTGLALGSQYDLYLWPEKVGSTIPGCVAMQPFATTAISTSAIVIDPVTSSTLYAGLDGAGVYASTDSSGNWTSISTAGLTNLNVRALAIQNSSTLFAATYDGGVFKGTKASGNWSWAVCDTGASLSAAVRLRSLIVDSAGNLYAGSETGVFKNTSACGAWTAQNTGMP
jgi:hypothetical protein